MRITLKTSTRLIAALAIGIPVLEGVATGRMIRPSRWDHVLLGILALGLAYLGTMSLIRDLKRSSNKHKIEVWDGDRLDP